MLPPLPIDYHWLADESGPLMLVRYLEIYGVQEAPGSADNPTIIGWAREVEKAMGKPEGALGYDHDQTAWCGLTAAVCAVRAGKLPIPETPLWALAWQTFGDPTDTPMLGDILVYRRTGGGHVGMYVGEDDLAYHVIAGNQGDAVTIHRLTKQPWRPGIGFGFYAARRPHYNVQPANVRVVHLSSTGTLSTQVS